MVAPEPEGDPPGSTSRVRTLHELLTAYDETLADSTAITAGLTPENWVGPASESYQERAKNPFEAALRAVREINAAALKEVEGHLVFRVQLANLWQDPGEHTHMRVVHQHASDQLAAELIAKAAELDRLANFNEVQPTPADPVVLPVPLPVPGSRRAEKPPAPEPRDEGGREDDDSAAASDGAVGGHGVLPSGTATASRDETERAAWMRAMPPPRTVRTDVIWDGD